jgi:hypothetical protein
MLFSAAFTVVGVVAWSAGCETVSETSDGRPMPPRARAVERAPPTAPINALSVLFGPQPADSNANGRPDRISVELYLFARPYPMPVWRQGTLYITAYPLGQAGSVESPSTKPFHEWRYTTNDLELGRFKSLIGEGYRFQFTLLGEDSSHTDADGRKRMGTDLVPNNALDLIARFEPVDGTPVVWCDGVRTLSFQPAGSPLGK